VTVERLTYAERLKVSPEAAQSLVKRLRLPRSRSNDGKTLVAVDFAELAHKPMAGRSPAGHHPVAALKARIEALQDALAKLEATASGHRADYERERDRADELLAELLRTTANLMAAREVTARMEGELSALRPPARSWWQRLRSTA
jgi:hypothetical protein